MAEALIFVVIGCGLLIALLRWLSLDRSTSLDPAELSEVHELLAAVQIDLPSRDIAERIFAPQDWKYIFTQASPKVRKLFLKERKALALSWLRQTRATVGRLMEFHCKAVWDNTNISPSTEIRLALGYGVFLLVYQLISFTIRFRGPLFARSILVYTGAIVESLSCTSVQILGHLDPARFYRIQNTWASRPVKN